MEFRPKIKKILALLLTGVFCYLIVNQDSLQLNKGTYNFFMFIYSTVMSFYFGQSAAIKAISEYKKQKG